MPTTTTLMSSAHPSVSLPPSSDRPEVKRTHQQRMGILRRSPFYDLPYFSMQMVQYDLMHTATGVLTTFVRALHAPRHPLQLRPIQCEDVSMQTACTLHVDYWRTPPPLADPTPLLCVLSHIPCSMQSEKALRKVQRPSSAYLRNDMKPLTQQGYPRAAEWLRLARGGHLTYILRHTQEPHCPRVPKTPRQAQAWVKWHSKRNHLLALHWMCTYIDALCAPVVDSAQLLRIQRLADKASGFWYHFLPNSMHTLLMHAMTHMAEQTENWGPQCVYWLFHKERSATTPCTPRAVRMQTACRTALSSPPLPFPSHAHCTATACAWCLHAPCVNRYIGFLTRCALSKPYPELSIVNTVSAMSLATGRISNELSEEIFGDSAEADQLAYAGLPTTRPQHLRSMPFRPVVPKTKPKKECAKKLQTELDQLNEGLRADLKKTNVRARIQAILHRLDNRWDVNSPSFNAAVCMHGVQRNVEYEKVWNSQPDGTLHAHDTSFINRHVFACPCNDDTGVEPAEGWGDDEVMCSLGEEEKLEEEKEDVPTSSTSVVSSQRQPFRHDEVVAYGLVKRWLVVKQAGIDEQGGELGGARKEALVVLAHVRIFEWSLEPETGIPILQHVQRSRAGYNDHYMLAQHIVCRITLSPLLTNTSQYFVAHAQ